MERDPLGFAWRAAPALHLAAFLLILLALPLGWLTLDLVRTAVDDAINGAAFEGAASARFLRVEVNLPERISETPLVLLPGMPLGPDRFVLATLLSLLAAAGLAGLLAWGLRACEAGIRGRALRRLRQSILEGIASARPSGRDDARQAASLAGEGAIRAEEFLGGALVVPAAGFAAVGLSLVYVASADWRLLIALAAGLVALALLWPRRLDAGAAVAEARRRNGIEMQRQLADLVRRLPALAAHGTAALERSRLSGELAGTPRPLQGAERRLGRATALAAFSSVFAAVFVATAGTWFAQEGRLSAGDVVAATAAAALAAAALARLLRWGRARDAARPLFDEVARNLGALQARNRLGAAAALPGAGVLVAENLSAYDPASGIRMPALDAAIAFPAHVALTGEAAAGPRVLAAVIGGQLDPSTGRLAYGGVDLAEVDPGERARRIAYAGGETILVPGSLRHNLLYGCPDPDAPEAEARLIEAASVVGLDAMIYARGLSGTINPVREPRLAAAIIETRHAVRAALAAGGCEALIEPFDPARYNRQATIGENILFGVALGDTFREANLPSHPFVRAILEAEGLTKPLTAMGLSIASGMVEIFANIPDGHPLFERLSFFAAEERGYFADLIERQGERRRGAESMRDRERLISLALRYSESRHRLGLLDEALETKLVAARAAFANLLPTSLKPAIEFYDPDALCAAASVLDNLLFGRVAQGRAGAEEDVRKVVRHVLSERGLDGEVARIGLDTRVDPRGGDLLPTEIAAIDVARCLVRRSDVVVIEHALDGLGQAGADALTLRLRRALIGRGLVLVAPELSRRMDAPPFDMVLRFERAGVAVEDRRRAPAPEPVVA